jgi:hypothetical protein
MCFLREVFDLQKPENNIDLTKREREKKKRKMRERKKKLKKWWERKSFCC